MRVLSLAELGTGLRALHEALVALALVALHAALLPLLKLEALEVALLALEKSLLTLNLLALLALRWTGVLTFIHRGEESVRDEFFLLRAARHGRALASDEGESQVVAARAKIHKIVVNASARKGTDLLAGEHLEQLLLAGELLALAVHDAEPELRVALAKI